ncbi:BglG family transcription antiterminator [Haloimpatiens sp. FM7330]|uniref:BglG family transcription antiterminator n=1 Tax=Haloimpatiens sp. FM7330 TaxID=3298610 RepID=UPI00362DEF4E
MYTLSKRQENIVTTLLELNEYITIKQLAEKFSVSSRTIRYDLDKIKVWLEENEVKLIKKTNKGVKIEDTPKRKKLIEKLKVINPKERVLTKEEREKLIFIDIYSKDFVKLDDLCNKLLISKSTLVNDIKNLQKELEPENIEIVYKNKVGFQLEGCESKIRKTIISYIRDVLNVNDIVKLLDKKKQCELKIIDYLSSNIKFININNIPKIFDILNEAEKYMNIKLADDAYTSLSIHILIAIKRMKNKYEIEMEDERLNYIKEKKEFIVATYISKRIEEEFNITFDDSEIANIALHLMGAKLYEDIDLLNKVETINLSIEDEIININDKIIEVAQREIGINLKKDEQLKKALLMHLKPAIYRLKNDMKITNPLLSEIKKRYPFIYQAAEKCSKIIEFYLKKHVPESEIGYIAMHLGAAFEKNYNSGNLVKALVVCTSGLATSQLLSIRLKKLVPEIKVVATCSIKDLDKYVSEVNIILSTVDFKIDDIPVIKVSPFLDEKDLIKVRQYIVKKSEINKFVHFNNINVDEEKYDKELDPMLKDILTVKDIELNVEVKDWKEAIIKAGNLLVDNDCVTYKYVESMVEAVEKYGPYIVIMPGIAFAHARPSEEVKKPCMSLITLKEPVNFNSGDKDPVSIVFAFGSVNKNSHLTALQDLANFLEKEENIQFLTNAVDKGQVITNIIEYEKNIDN